MIEKIIFATGNQNKLTEIRQILGDFSGSILSMKEAGVSPEIAEDGETFEENALIKARAVWKETGHLVLADDSGLEIDALGGEPGVYSARYLGEDTSYHIKNSTLIGRLEGVEDEKRTARFVCAVAAVFPDGSESVVRGVMEGRIGYEERGSNGFGYDPIFILPKYNATTAELAPEVKNLESHRGQALRAMREEIRRYADTHRQ